MHKIIKAINDIPEQVKDIVMTTYDQLIKKGIQEGEVIGMQKGEVRGEMKAKTKTILKSFELGMEISMIANITDLRVTNFYLFLLFFLLINYYIN